MRHRSEQRAPINWEDIKDNCATLTTALGAMALAFLIALGLFVIVGVMVWASLEIVDLF